MQMGDKSSKASYHQRESMIHDDGTSRVSSAHLNVQITRDRTFRRTKVRQVRRIEIKIRLNIKES